MSDRNFDFARLIAPIATDSFFHNTWEKEPLLVARNDPNYYSGLFSMRDVGSVIYFTRPRFLGNRLRTTKMHTLAGVFADQERFFSAGENEVSALSDEYAQGRSIFVHGLEKRWQPVSELCRDLESTLRHPVGAMMFLTPKGSQGIEAHFDNVETFILQIEGSKHWRLYKPTVLLPLKEEYELTGEDEEPQLMQEIHLKAGDLLYFPRGHIHEAFTSDYSSLHITVGVSVLRWADLLSAALARLSKRDIRLREALPVGLVGRPDQRQLVNHRFHELVQSLAANLKLTDALDELGERFINDMPALPAGHFVPREKVECVHLDTVLAKTKGTICRVIQQNNSVVIHFPGHRMKAPQATVPALEFIAAAEHFLVSALPGNLSDNAKLVLCRRLVRDGLLTIVKDSLPVGA